MHDCGTGLCSLQNSLCTLVLHFTYFFERKKWRFLLQTCSSEADVQLVQTCTVLLKYLPSVGFLGKVLDSNHFVSVEKEGNESSPCLHRPAASQSCWRRFPPGSVPGWGRGRWAALLSLSPLFPSGSVCRSACCQHEFGLFENSVSFERSLVKNHLFKWYKWNYLQNRLTELTVGEGN